MRGEDNAQRLGRLQTSNVAKLDVRQCRYLLRTAWSLPAVQGEHNLNPTDVVHFVSNLQHSMLPTRLKLQLV